MPNDVTTEWRSPRGRRRRKSGAAAALAAVLAVGIAGCGSSSSSSTTSSSPSGGSSTASSSSSSSSSSPISAALTKFEAATSSYAVPTSRLKGVSKLKGKTIFYIPVASVVPEFAITAGNMKAATQAVGAKLSVCSDPTGTPSEWNSCVGQAISHHVAAIVLDAAPWQVVANQLVAAQKQGIKVVLADQQPSTSFSKPGDNVFILGVSGAMQTAAADWIINDSGAKGNALIVQDTDGPSPPWYITHFALPQFRQYAPNLKYKIQPISTANQQQLSGDVSSNLLKNPSTKYIYTEFDQFLPNAQAGVQSANATQKLKGVSTTALLAGLQLLKSGQYSYADVGDDFPYSAWAIADEAYRLMLGQPTVTETIPLRLFTRQNVSSVPLTTAAQNDGAWYGATNFPSLFKKVWGVG